MADNFKIKKWLSGKDQIQSTVRKKNAIKMERKKSIKISETVLQRTVQASKASKKVKGVIPVPSQQKHNKEEGSFQRFLAVAFV
jgi:hypothetical protein